MVFDGAQILAGWWMLIIVSALLIPCLLEGAGRSKTQPTAVPAGSDRKSQRGGRSNE